jgi:hypothetical protein
MFQHPLNLIVRFAPSYGVINMKFLEQKAACAAYDELQSAVTPLHSVCDELNGSNPLDREEMGKRIEAAIDHLKEVNEWLTALKAA